MRSCSNYYNYHNYYDSSYYDYHNYYDSSYYDSSYYDYNCDNFPSSFIPKYRICSSLWSWGWSSMDTDSS
jgi:hypothetical protein